MTRPVVPTFAYFRRVLSLYAMSVAVVTVLSLGAVMAYCRPMLFGALGATFLVGIAAGRINIGDVLAAAASRLTMGKGSPPSVVLVSRRRDFYAGRWGHLLPLAGEGSQATRRPLSGSNSTALSRLKANGNALARPCTVGVGAHAGRDRLAAELR